MGNRWNAETLDAALHLLDRQVVDVDDLPVCKVDDLEISLDRDGAAAVTRILTGPAALVPRLSGRTGHVLRDRWVSLGLQYADRDVPLAVPLEVVRNLGSAVELSVSRVGLLDRQPSAPDGVELRRMGELLGMRLRAGGSPAHGPVHSTVLDVRLRPQGQRLVLTDLVVGPGRPGSLLGYDRGDLHGPWLVRAVVRGLHRHLRLVAWDDVATLDWDQAQVHLRPEAETRPVRE